MSENAEQSFRDFISASQNQINVDSDFFPLAYKKQDSTQKPSLVVSESQEDWNCQ